MRIHSAIVCVAVLAAVIAEAQPSASSTARLVPNGRVAHVLVALADNRYQGIVPVPQAIGNGDDPVHNLYWGAGYGLKTFFRKSADWELVGRCGPGRAPVLERCVFHNRHQNIYVVADAYRGREIRRTISDFFAFAAGRASEEIAFVDSGVIKAGGASDLVAFVGHDGLMDFALDRYQYSVDDKSRDTMIISCASKNYFADALRWTGAKPLLWTTGLMAPEAYVIEAALAGWAQNESGEQIRGRAAKAYDQYQHTGPKAAIHLFATGW